MERKPRTGVAVYRQSDVPDTPALPPDPPQGMETSSAKPVPAAGPPAVAASPQHIFSTSGNTMSRNKGNGSSDNL